MEEVEEGAEGGEGEEDEGEDEEGYGDDGHGVVVKRWLWFEVVVMLQKMPFYTLYVGR